MDPKPVAPSSAGPSLSDQHKDSVRRWIGQLRASLQDDFDAALQRYGFRRDGRHTAESDLALPMSELPVRRALAALIEHDTKAEGTPQRGFDAVVRELTYTLVNRLVGLKVMEARNLLRLRPPDAPADAAPEPTEVLTPQPGQERSRFLRDFRAAGGSRYKYEDDAEEALLRDGLTAAFTQLHADLGPLFAPDHDYACLWPSYAALSNALRLINDGLPPTAYQAPDFLGWVYQFFNVGEKDRVRAENKGTPRSPYELSVINQFYTPSWVVKVLVDNTLGRLWVQMHPDTALLPKTPPPLPSERPAGMPPVADYLVPRTGEKIRFRRVEADGSVSPFKRVRDIRFLDPACGTLHFGQYAFGLFYRMYEEEITHVGQPGWPAEPSVADKRDIPAAILEHNLCGIDIDPRAIQIATLSLLFTAKEAAQRARFDPSTMTARPRNVVLAQAVQVDAEQLRALVDRVGVSLGSPELRQKLFDALWKNLRYIGELGGLIRMDDDVSSILEQWVNEKAEQQGLTKLLKTTERKKDQLQFGELVADVVRQKAEQQELKRVLLEDEAARIRAELLGGLDQVASQVSDNPRQRLFAEGTARGLRLLELLSAPFDVIVMNPPYGSFTKLENAEDDRAFKAYRESAFPNGYQDIYAAFIERATQLIEPEGYIGALVSSTFKTNKGHAKFRTEILLKRNPIVCMLDLGFGILDGATVEAAALVLRGNPL
ncbi:hypothetical protein OPIT5_23265 [Opitutaceae bacterium TAV5]|nr:hypothetical protein OPIT5_23265 [Opitutaceae bacterium TAV5]